MRQATFGAMAVLCGLLLMAGDRAAGQDKKAWPPKEIKSTGKAWGIYMKPPKLEAIPDKGTLVAEADSEGEAKKIADALFNDPRNKFPSDLFSAVKRDNGDKDTGAQPTLTLPLPDGKKLVVPLSNVDPKPLPKAKPPIIELAGKKAKGKIGDSNVTFDFQKGNKLVITGDVEGEGEWGLTEDKLTMTTKLAVFLGTVDKDGKMKGKRVKRDGKELLDWSAATSKTVVEDVLIGTTWTVRGSHRRVGNGFNGTCSFLTDGKCRLVMNGSEYECTWSRNGDRLTIDQDSKSGGAFSLDIGAAELKGGNGEWRVSLEKQ